MRFVSCKFELVSPCRSLALSFCLGHNNLLLFLQNHAMETINPNFLEWAVPAVEHDLSVLLDWVKKGGWWKDPEDLSQTEPVPEPVLDELKVRISDALSKALEGVDSMVAQMKLKVAADATSRKDSVRYTTNDLAKNWVAVLLLREVQKAGQRPWTYNGTDNPIPPDGTEVLLRAWLQANDGYGYGLEDPENEWFFTDLGPREIQPFGLSFGGRAR